MHRKRRRRCWYAAACHPFRYWLLHGPLMARFAAAAMALALLWVCEERVDWHKVIDVSCYAFAELGAYFVRGGE